MRFTQGAYGNVWGRLMKGHSNFAMTLNSSLVSAGLLGFLLGGAICVGVFLYCQRVKRSRDDEKKYQVSMRNSTSCSTALQKAKSRSVKNSWGDHFAIFAANATEPQEKETKSFCLFVENADNRHQHI